MHNSLDTIQNPELAKLPPHLAWMLSLAVQFIDDWQDDDGKDADSAKECEDARAAHTQACDWLVQAQKFIGLTARMTADGEEIDGDDGEKDYFDMSGDDAVSTLGELIEIARQLNA